MSDDDVGLRDYFDAIITRRDREVDLAHRDMLARLASMNEFRRQLERERNDYVHNRRYEERHEALNLRIGLLEVWQANVAGRVVAFGALWTVFVGVVVGIATRAFG